MDKILVRLFFGLLGRFGGNSLWPLAGAGLALVVIFGALMLFAPVDSYAPQIVAVLGKFPRRDDGQGIVLAPTSADPGDWFGAHWNGPVPGGLSGAMYGDTTRWVLTGNVEGLPMMLVCLLHEPKSSKRTTAIHLFVAHRRFDSPALRAAPHATIESLNCEATRSEWGVHVSRDKIAPVLSVEKLSALGRAAAELSRE